MDMLFNKMPQLMLKTQDLGNGIQVSGRLENKFKFMSKPDVNFKYLMTEKSFQNYPELTDKWISRVLDRTALIVQQKKDMNLNQLQ